jgi:DNA polymerase I
MQANGAEMMRLACILATERGIRVLAPVHDARLIEAADGDIEVEVNRTQEAMAEASRVILDGAALRSDVKIIRYPDRYRDEERGGEFWDAVMRRLDEAGT